MIRFYSDSKGNTTTSLEDHLIVSAKNRYKGNESSRDAMPKTIPALICLHGGCTEYLKKFDEKVNPFELPVMEIKLPSNSNGTAQYGLLDDSDEIISAFANEFQNRYPDREQVYVCSTLYKMGFEDIHILGGGMKRYAGPKSIQSYLSSILPNIFMKKTILVPKDIYWLDHSTTQLDKMNLDRCLQDQWRRDQIPSPTDEGEILKIVKNSLNFRNN